MSWLLLSAAVLCEVSATLCLRVAAGGRRAGYAGLGLARCHHQRGVLTGGDVPFQGKRSQPGFHGADVDPVGPAIDVLGEVNPWEGLWFYLNPIFGRRV